MNQVLAEVLDDAESARGELLTLIDGLTPAQWESRAPEGGWTVGEVVGHLQLVEDSSVRALFKGFRRAREAGLGEETDGKSRLASLGANRVDDLVRPIVAPPMVTPNGTGDRGELKDKLAYSRDGLRKWAQEADGFALSKVRFPHPAFGELDLYQWVLFIGQHERRHIRQIRRILGMS